MNHIVSRWHAGGKTIRLLKKAIKYAQSGKKVTVLAANAEEVRRLWGIIEGLVGSMDEIISLPGSIDVVKIPTAKKPVSV